MEPTVAEAQDAREQLVALVSGRMTRSMLTTTVNTQQVLDNLFNRAGAIGAQRIQILLNYMLSPKIPRTSMMKIWQ